MPFVSFSKSNVRNITSTHMFHGTCTSFHRKAPSHFYGEARFLRRSCVFLRRSKGWPVSICHRIWYEIERGYCMTYTHKQTNKHDPITVHFYFRIIFRETCWQNVMIFESIVLLLPLAVLETQEIFSSCYSTIVHAWDWKTIYDRAYYH